jgi:hypothetical protein
MRIRTLVSRITNREAECAPSQPIAKRISPSFRDMGQHLYPHPSVDTEVFIDTAHSAKFSSAEEDAANLSKSHQPRKRRRTRSHGL